LVGFAFKWVRVGWTYEGPSHAGGTRPLTLWFTSLRLFGGNAEFVSHSHQINQRPRLHLSRDLAAMDLHRHLAQFELSCDLFVRTTRDDEREDFSFSQRQRIEARLQFGTNFGLLTPSTVALDRHLDRIEQLLLGTLSAKEGNPT
jgi:hypothetical protein